MGKMTGNEFLVKALQEEGVEKIFGYPGACVIDIFDEIYKQDQVELILPRHEQGLIHAADGYARATGKVGGNKWTRCHKPCYRNSNSEL